MPAGLAAALPSGATDVLGNPQALLNPEATVALQQRFVSLGPQGQGLFEQFLGALRTSLSGAITDLFAVSCLLMVLGLAVTLFLPEIELSRRRRGPAGETDSPETTAVGRASDPAGTGGSVRRR
jgi:hypothetical protein